MVRTSFAEKKQKKWKKKKRKWKLKGPLPKLCPVIPTSNQDGHQAKNRKKGG
jgi:hypothetical protein